MMDILTSRNTRTILNKVSDNADTIRASQGNVSDLTASERSELSLDDHDFEFDSLVLNTDIYKKAWVMAKKKKSRQKKSMPRENVIRSEHWYLAIAMATFVADPQKANQISVSRFETVEVSCVQESTDGHRGWWQARKDTGETGLVPQKYLCLFDAHLSMHQGSKALREPRHREWMHSADPPSLVKAVFSYIANPDNRDKLSSDKDEIIEVRERVRGWWNARKQNGETGIVPSPYFIYAEEARETLRPLPTSSSYRLTPYVAVEASDPSNSGPTTYREPSVEFAFLDDPDVAQAVWCASDQYSPRDSKSSSVRDSRGGKASRIRVKQKGKSKEPVLRTTDPDGIPPGGAPDRGEYAAFTSHGPSPDPYRFVSQTEFQSFLFHILTGSVIDEMRFSIAGGKMEAWINWIMVNPGDDDFDAVELDNFEDEIRSAVVPQLIGFEGEQWGNKSTGAVLDAWVRQAIDKGAFRDSLLRESVRDLLTLWQDSKPGRGKRSVVGSFSSATNLVDQLALSSSGPPGPSFSSIESVIGDPPPYTDAQTTRRPSTSVSQESTLDQRSLLRPTTWRRKSRKHKTNI